MPLGFAEDKGILKKWGDKYGIELKAVRLNDYVEAPEPVHGGAFDAVIAVIARRSRPFPLARSRYHGGPSLSTSR